MRPSISASTPAARSFSATVVRIFSTKAAARWRLSSTLAARAS